MCAGSLLDGTATEPPSTKPVLSPSSSAADGAGRSGVAREPESTTQPVSSTPATRWAAYRSGSLDASTSTATAPDGQLGSGAAGASCAPAGDANTIVVLATTSNSASSKKHGTHPSGGQARMSTRDLQSLSTEGAVLQMTGPLTLGAGIGRCYS